MGFYVDEKIMKFCKLVCFAQNEIDLCLTSEENEGVGVEMMIDNFKKSLEVENVNYFISFPHTPVKDIIKEKMKYGNYINRRVNGEWEFGISNPEPISIEVLTNGEIHLDYSNAEDIFRFEYC